MTTEQFRSLALQISGALESSHMGHPDFRLGGRIFASLGYPNDNYGMVKLTPEEQQTFITQAPAAFHPCAGAWGKQGSTSVALSIASVALVRAALDAAAKNVALRRRRSKSPRPAVGPDSLPAGRRRKKNGT